MSATVIQLPFASGDTSKPFKVRDQVLANSNDGVRFLADTAFPYSYPGGAISGRPAAGAPANQALIQDASDHANGLFQKSATQTIGYAGNMFDFSTMTATTGSTVDELCNIKATASVWADINASQYFMVVAYMRLPNSTDWNSSATIYPFFCSSVGGYTAAADPITLAMTSAGAIDARRQTAIGAATTITASAVSHYGRIAQVAFWRNAAGTGVWIKSSAGATLTTGAAGSNNSADISACTPMFGSVNPFTDYSTAAHRTARNYRLGRVMIENLAQSGRDPAAVLDADYARVIARGVFS